MQLGTDILPILDYLGTITEVKTQLMQFHEPLFTQER